MITSEALLQVKAFARQDGLILSLVWLASMCMMFQAPDNIWGPLMALSTPFFVAWRLQRFRNYALDGVISFRRGLMFSCYVFFYASLVFAVGQFLYFKYIDGGAFMQMMSTGVETWKAIYKEQGLPAQDLDVMLKTIQMMKPVDLTFTFMMNNLLLGAFVSPLISLSCRKAKK